MRRVRRIAIIALTAVLALIVLAYFGQFAYLRTGSAKQLAASKIAEKLGGNVRVTELSGGLGSTDLHIEIDGSPGEKPLVTGKVRVDVSPLGLAVGNEPSEIHLDNPTVNLHLDQDNNILDKLPQPKGGAGGGKIPNIVIAGATVHFTQAGKPDFSVAGVDITITSSGVKSTAAGGFNDRQYGPWKISGDYDSGTSVASVQLKSDGQVHLTPEKLKAIPFVPKETWEAVELDGLSAVDVVIGRSAEGKWSWKVECDPTGTLLKVFPIDLVTTDTSAKVIVEGAIVTLKSITGKTADGIITADSVLDFEKKPSNLRFKVVAKDLDVKKTPAKWNLAPLVDQGRLNGDADITLLVSKDEMTPRGNGKAKIKGKVFGGTEEIELNLTDDGKKLKFVQPPMKSSQLVPGAVLPIALGFLLQATPKKRIEPKEAKPEYVQANIKLKDIDIAEFIMRGNIRSPVKLAGKGSLDIAAEIPTNNLGGIKFYKATGKLTVPSLQIEGLTLSDVTSDIQLKDGVLTLNRLSASFAPGSDGKSGSFLGTAKFGIDPRTELTAQLILDAIPLDQVFAALPGFAGKADGSISGSFDLTMPGDKLGDLKTLVANGKLNSKGLTLFGQKADKLDVQLAVKDGMAKLTKAEVEIYKGTITGDAKLPLVGDANGTFQIGFKDVDADMVTRAIPSSPVKLAGKLVGTLDGTVPPLNQFDASKIKGDLSLNSPQLVVQGIPTSKLAGKVGYKTGAITYDLKGDALGGSFDVEGIYPLTTPTVPEMGKVPEKPLGGTIRINRWQLDRLGRDLKMTSLNALQGVLSMTLRYTHGADGLHGNGRLEIRDFGWGGDFADTSDVASEILVTSEGFEIPSINGDLAGGRLAGRLRYDFDRPRLSFVTLRLENADATALLEPFGFDVAKGRVSATLRSNLGREFRGGGTITALRTSLSGIDVSELRIPYTFAKAPGGGAQFTVTDARGTVANGRLTGKTDIVWNDTARVEGRIEFVDVNISEVAKASGGSALGIGKTTGRFDFTGSNVRTSDDLKGDLTASFGQTSVREIPILGSISPLMSPVQALTRFDGGDLVARLGSGQFRVERLALTNKSVKLFADGTVGLNGALDLGVVYNTGQIGPSAPLLRTILRDIPAIGPIPVGLIVRVTEAISNRVVRLRIGGTISKPSAQLNAVGLLTENAVRFFAGQYVPLPAATK
jgi:hypothetical protein